ncbi:transposase [Aliivibrio kagoshimensis]|uniref:transposase n=1 Tax=Aliivibrio kagoshimensis TaxID=2910230 RepID=UPI003D10B90A
MTVPRSQLICSEATPYYHIVSRCVRRSYLCGVDSVTQQSFEHRRGWIEDKLKELSAMFCIDICAYAIMNNHYHLVLSIDCDGVKNLSEQEVVDRWCSLHEMPVLIHRYLTKQDTHSSTKVVCQQIISEWRERLSSISWFMKIINQTIARLANKEDDCTGHFWEGRFKSQALLDEKALLTAMAYVDLNPIRASMADSLETSDFTSVKERLAALKSNKLTPPCLHPFIGNPTNEVIKGIPFRLDDYLELVDWSGKQIKPNKRGAIDASAPPVLQQLNVEQKEWLTLCTTLEQNRASIVGEVKSYSHAIHKLNRKRSSGLKITTAA